MITYSQQNIHSDLSISDLKTKINSGKFILQSDSINSLQNNKPFPKVFFKSL